MNTNQELVQLLRSKGAALVGFADLGDLDPDVRGGLPYGISIGVALTPSIVAGIADGPTAVYNREYREVNVRLAALAEDAAGFLEKQGHQAVACHPTIGEDEKTLATRLPHKTVATRAGLGWIGKCALLVTPEYGSAVRLVTVLTDAPVETGVPVNVSKCGDCTACVDACPAHAVSGRNWVAGLPREALYDAHACRKIARELTFEAFGEEVSICGRCITVCPWTRKYLAKNR